MNSVWKHITLPEAVKEPVLAAGGDLKNTLCVAAGNDAWISHVRDDLADADTCAEYIHAVHQFPEECGVKPMRIAYDMHPGYISHTIIQRDDVWPDVPRYEIQHHEAHATAVSAATLETGAVCVMSCDGTGYGLDDTLWGGEFFTGNYNDGYTRMGRLHQFPLPGGEAAIKEPWRIGVALARTAGVCEEDARFCIGDIKNEDAWRVVWQMSAPENHKTLRTSSMGRLFDGVSALLGIKQYVCEEAEAAIALEKCASNEFCVCSFSDEVCECVVQQIDGIWEIDWRPLVCALCAGRKQRCDIAMLSSCFHDALAEAACHVCHILCGDEITTVLGSGGVFWNKRFTRGCASGCKARGMTFTLAENIPPSDAALSLGQAVCAGMK